MIFDKISEDPNYIIYVAEYNGEIIGATTLLIEQKFIHDGGKVEFRGSLERAALA